MLPSLSPFPIIFSPVTCCSGQKIIFQPRRCPRVGVASVFKFSQTFQGIRKFISKNRRLHIAVRRPRILYAPFPFLSWSTIAIKQLHNRVSNGPVDTRNTHCIFAVTVRRLVMLFRLSMLISSYYIGNA